MYCITLGNFETKHEAQKFIEQLVRNYSAAWTPGEPVILSDDCGIEEKSREKARKLRNGW